MKLKYLHHNAATDTCEHFSILGCEGDDFIVSDGIRRFQVCSYQMFTVDGCDTYIEPDHAHPRVLCGEIKSCRERNIFFNIKEFSGEVWKNWAYLSIQNRRNLLLTCVRIVKAPLAIVAVLILSLIYWNLSISAEAPYLKNDDRRREFVYLALNRSLDSFRSTEQNSLVVMSVKPDKPSRRTNVPRRTAQGTCKRRTIDSDVLKFLPADKRNKEFKGNTCNEKQ